MTDDRKNTASAEETGEGTLGSLIKRTAVITVLCFLVIVSLIASLIGCFFPKAYMRKAHPEVDDWLVNHIGNITIVDDFLNKRSIRDRAPSKYISEYMAQNPNLEKALNSHLISAASGWGVLEDDYQTFFQNRLNWFCEELNKRVIVTQADRTA